ncbi:unnamed protein product [Withania somnifera]
MEVASKRWSKLSRNGVVVAGSVWENRMRFDEFKGGINVYSEKEETAQVENDEKISTPSIISGEKTNHQVQVDKKMDLMGSKANLDVAVDGGVMSNGKRKNWKSESNFEGSSIRKCKELTVGAMKISPNQKKKSGLLSDGNEKMCNGNVRSSIQMRKMKLEMEKKVVDESKKNLERVFDESSDGNERSGVQLRKVKSDKCEEEVDENSNNSDVLIEENKVVDDVENKVVVVDDVFDETKKHLERVFSESSDGNEGNGIQLRKVKSDKCEEFDENSVFSESSDGNGIQLRKVKSEANKVENEKDCDLSKVKSLCLDENLRNSIQLEQLCALKLPLKTKSEKCKKVFEENKVVVVDESKKNLEGSFERKRSSNNVEPQEKLNLENEDTKKIVIVEENKVHISNNEKKPVAISPIIKKQSPLISGQSRIHHHPSPSRRTKPVPTSDESQSNFPRQHSKLESFVDLIMWKDESKSAFIFGIGTFFIISSSYTQDLNISFISVISYLGLVYLATIFLFRSLRGANDIGESSEYVLGEEAAMWILRLILPYINECLMKIRALFSGDPATTMKMAVLLFILARCGSSITIWKMSKLVFGVFIIPKVCSSYSTQLTAYGTFWIRRFRDAWVSCTHKKAVAFAIFTFIWNLSSISARIWAVFMLYVGFRYYQQKMMKEGWAGEEITKSEDYWQGKNGGQR